MLQFKRLSFIVRVNVVLNRTVVVDSDWRFDLLKWLLGSNLSQFYRLFISHITLVDLQDLKLSWLALCSVCSVMNYSTRVIKISVIFLARLIYGGLLNACSLDLMWGRRKETNFVYYLFIYLFINLFIHSFVRLFIHLLTYTREIISLKSTYQIKINYFKFNWFQYMIAAVNGSLNKNGNF